MKKLTKTISALEGLKSESSIGNVREIVSLVSAIFAASKALGLDDLIDEFNTSTSKKYQKAVKIVAKNPQISFDELVKKIIVRK